MNKVQKSKSSQKSEYNFQNSHNYNHRNMKGKLGATSQTVDQISRRVKIQNRQQKRTLIPDSQNWIYGSFRKRNRKKRNLSKNQCEIVFQSEMEIHIKNLKNYTNFQAGQIIKDPYSKFRSILKCLHTDKNREHLKT